MTAFETGSESGERRGAINPVRLIAACTIGNALEFFDFLIFSFFARTIGQLFFPAADATAQLLLALATFGIGFFLRPLGGVVIGAYADRKGRKKATILTLMLMALGTGMIGIAPTYAQAGVFAPAIILIGRLVQGFSAGGEVGASTTLLAEYASPEKRGFFGSWQLASQGLAVLVAAGVAYVISSSLSPAEVASWGWRLPFILGVLIVPIGLWLRTALEETHANETDASKRDVSELRVALGKHFSTIVSGVGLVIGGTAANAIVVLYMATYAVTQLKMAPTTGLLAGMAAGIATLVAAPIGGLISDRVGRRGTAAVAYLLILVCIYPAFLYLNANPTPGVLLSIVLFLAALNGIGGSIVIISCAEIFPVEVRATGMSIVYALGVAIFGGFGQFIVTWMIQLTGNPIAPAYYVMVCSLATLAALWSIPEMARRKLD